MNTMRPSSVESEAAPWFSSLRLRGLSESTIESAHVGLRRLDVYLRKNGISCDAKQLTEQQLLDWRSWLMASEYKMSSVDGSLRAARGYLGWLFKRGEIFANPAEHLDTPRYHRPMQYVPCEQTMARLLSSLNGKNRRDLRDRAIFETAYATGLRISELRILDIGSLDLENRTVRVMTKGRRERVLPLTRAAVSALRIYLDEARPRLAKGGKPTEALWLRFHGQRLTQAGLHQIAERRGRAIGIRLTMHALRRAFATHLLLHGATVAEVKELLGHCDFKHMKHYVRYVPQELREIHQKSKLGK